MYNVCVECKLSEGNSRGSQRLGKVSWYLHVYVYYIITIIDNDSLDYLISWMVHELVTLHFGHT